MLLFQEPDRVAIDIIFFYIHPAHVNQSRKHFCVYDWTKPRLLHQQSHAGAYCYIRDGDLPVILLVWIKLFAE